MINTETSNPQGTVLGQGRLRWRLGPSPVGLAILALEDSAQDVQWFRSDAGAPIARFGVLGAQGAQETGTIGAAVSPAITLEPPGALSMSATSPSSRLEFTIELAPVAGGWAVSGAVSNHSDEALSVELRLPWFEPADVPAGAVAMLPIEAGSVRPLASGGLSFGGFFTHLTFECAGSSMPVAHVGLPEGNSGVALVLPGEARADNILECSPAGVGRRCTVYLPPGASTDLAPCYVIATDGDWHASIDLVDRLCPVDPPDTPDWFRYAGAIHNPLAEGGGGIYQIEETVSLTDRIDSFLDLPDLLDEARDFGTEVVQLFDYWDSPFPDARPAYWHKGDYLPRAALGGLPALAAGVEQLHRQGGRILLYLEPFIVYRDTIVGRERGQDWAARDPWTGELLDIYPDNYTMPPWHPGWRQWVLDKARWIVGEVGADGVFLDSFGWQWNWLSATGDDPRPRDARTWNDATVSLVREVRQVIRAIRPDAVVMTESLPATLLGVSDGGLDASFAWNASNNRPGPLRSPVRAARPGVGIFTNGSGLAELHEVFANGLNLALSRRWLPHRYHIRQLVELRRSRRDSLVDGTVREMAEGSDRVLGLHYTGDRSEVVVLLSRDATSQTVTLPSGGMWTSEIGPMEGQADGVVTIPPGGLVAMSRARCPE